MIVVTGSATGRIRPDIATWRAIVETRSRTQREAFGKCSSDLATVLDAALAAADPNAEVSASGVHVWAHWDPERSRYEGFAAQAAVEIRAPLEDAAKLGQAALDAGALRLDGPAYEATNDGAIRDGLLADAVRSARSRAERMAEAAGVGVGAAIGLRDRSGGAVDDPWAGKAMVRMQAMESAEAPPLEPAGSEVRVEVEVVFEIAPRSKRATKGSSAD